MPKSDEELLARLGAPNLLSAEQLRYAIATIVPLSLAEAIKQHKSREFVSGLQTLAVALYSAVQQESGLSTDTVLDQLCVAGPIRAKIAEAMRECAIEEESVRAH